MKDILGAKTLESMSQAVWYNQWTLKKIKPYIKGKILEVGCGIGNFTKDLTKYGEVYAIDIDKDYIEYTSRLINGAGKVGFGDIEKGKYFFENEKFNTIVCINVLEHIEKDIKALENLYKLLDKEGTLILLVPAYDFLYGKIDKSIGHFRRYNKNSLKNQLVEVGFKIINVRILNFLGALGWWFSSKLLSDKKVDGYKIKLFNLISPVFLSIEDLIEPPLGTSILIIAKK